MPYNFWKRVTALSFLSASSWRTVHHQVPTNRRTQASMLTFPPPAFWLDICRRYSETWRIWIETSVVDVSESFERGRSLCHITCVTVLQSTEVAQQTRVVSTTPREKGKGERAERNNWGRLWMWARHRTTTTTVSIRADVVWLLLDCDSVCVLLGRTAVCFHGKWFIPVKAVSDTCHPLSAVLLLLLLLAQRNRTHSCLTLHHRVKHLLRRHVEALACRAHPRTSSGHAACPLRSGTVWDVQIGGGRRWER